MLRLLLILLIGCSLEKVAAQVDSFPFDQNKLHGFFKNHAPLNVKKQATETHKSTYRLLAFLSPECPLSQNYSVVLQQLSNEFSDLITVSGIIPGSTVSKKEIRGFAKKYKIQFPLYSDKNMITVKTVHATITPEVVLMDKDGVLIYRGAIDDWAVDLGKKKSKPSNEYLRNALLQVKMGQPVQFVMKEPIGCLINDF
ncbi:MAG: redoxin domain-containing protein [Flavipsychrobacter sp.]|nr:redoxin domain-containing protein [Flavipsychrobacter sp.]